MSRPFPTIRKRPAMLRILLPYVMHVHDQLEQLSTLPDEETARWPTVTSIMGAGGTLRQLLDESVYSPYLHSSTQLGRELLFLLDMYISGDKKNEASLYQRPPDLTQGDSHERRDLIQWHQGKGGFDGSKDYAQRQVRRRASPGSGAVPGWESGATDVGDCPGSGWG